MSLKRTPLYAAHQKLGARLVEFGGWEMPVQYSTIIDEHLCVRRAAGLFDISHMGEVFVSGPQALAFLNHTLTNDVRKLGLGQGQYTLLCNERGGVVDDLYLYRLAENEFLLIVNASRIETDVAWLQQRHALWRRGGVTLDNASDRFGAVALQGPRAREFIDPCVAGSPRAGWPVSKASELKKNQLAVFDHAGQSLYVASTGYTGEDGFEIVAPAALLEPLWSQILVAGHAYCCQAVGLGARDTLRTEMCYPLYGHELDEDTTPIEAGLGFFVALDKGAFVGRDVLAEQKANGVKKKLIAFKLTAKFAPPRPSYAIYASGKNDRLGQVTSGTQSPSLGLGIGLGYVEPQFAGVDTLIDVEVRGRRGPAVVVAKPIYRRNA